MDSPPTWGIPDPVFLTLFVVAMFALTAFALSVRFRFDDSLPRMRELHGYVPARSGGGGRAVVACLVFLRSKGLIEVEADGTLRATGDGEGLTDPLDRAVLQAVAQGAAFEDLSRNGLVGEAVAHLAGEYRDWEAGAPAAYFARMHRTKLALLPLGLLIPVGAAWLWAGGAHGEHAGVLLLLLLLLSLGMEIAALALWWVPRFPPEDLEVRVRQRNLSLMQRRLQELRSAPPRDGAGIGAAEAVLEMTFFGRADLEAVDPDLHAVLRAAALRREAEAAEARRREAEAAEVWRREAEAQRREAEETEARRAEIAARWKEREEVEARWKEREARREKPKNGSEAGSTAMREELARRARELGRDLDRSSFSWGSSYGGVYDGPSSTGSSSTDDGGGDSGSSCCSIGCSSCGSAINCT